MNTRIDKEEQDAESAFSTQSVAFDRLYSGNPIIQYKRDRVRSHLMRYARAGDHMLELNSGTGEDAIFFAKHHLRVHATDISSGMQQVLVQKVEESGMGKYITNERCSFTRLDELMDQGPYDIIFSNFAGLNCTGRLDNVLSSCEALLKPGGFLTLVIMPPFCLWEFLMLFRGKLKTALRRSFTRKGVKAHLVDRQYFTCWYYQPAFVSKLLSKGFSVVDLEGLCTLVPPSYLEHFSVRYPRLYEFLKRKEAALKSKWPWRSIGDYYIITLRKR